ncbi:MAG TPA: polymerase [Mucilaginibacter sp.]
MKRLVTLLIIFFGFKSAYAQIQYLPKFVRRMYFNEDTGRRNSFVLLPVLNSAPETGLEVGAAGLYSFYTDTIHRDTRVSNVFGYATITTKAQSRFSLSTSYWTSQNKFHYIADISYIYFPFDFYGIGNNTSAADKENVNQTRSKFDFDGEMLLGGNFYVGYVFGAFNYHFTSNNPQGLLYTDPEVQSRYGGSSIFIGPSLIFDNRNNNTYTTKGVFVRSYLNLMQGLFDNNGYQGSLFDIEYSQFFSISKKFVLGLDAEEQSLLGGSSPFYLMPQMGSDELMRGYYTGRYRDRNYIAGQAELRYRIVKSFGIVGFVGTGEVFHSDFTFPELKPNYGGGIRYFFDIQKGLSVRVDYGVGEKPAGEKRETGLYVGLGQAF